jgi:hypothetical protein
LSVALLCGGAFKLHAAEEETRPVAEVAAPATSTQREGEPKSRPPLDAPKSAAAPPAAPVTVAETASPPPPVVPAPAPPPVAIPTRVEGVAVPGLATGGEGTFRFGTVLQGWSVTDQTKGGSADPRTNVTTSMRVRRGELYLKGDVTSRFSWWVMLDVARVLEPVDQTLPVASAADPSVLAGSVVVKQSTTPLSMLQDVFMTHSSTWLDLSVGQFLTPISLESASPSAMLVFPDRAPVVRQLAERRDIGVKVGKSFRYLSYVLGAFNGSGQNIAETDRRKDLALRLEVYPVSGLLLGGLAYSTAATAETGDIRQRFEGDIRYQRAGFLFQGEYIRARDWTKSVLTSRRGFYALAALTIADRLQPAVRVGYYDANIDRAADQYWHWDVGLSYFISGPKAKVQASFAHVTYDLLNPVKVSNNQLILAMQVAY